MTDLNRQRGTLLINTGSTFQFSIYLRNIYSIIMAAYISDSDDELFLTQHEKAKKRTTCHIKVPLNINDEIRKFEDIIGHTILWHEDFTEHLIPRNRHLKPEENFNKYWKLFCYLHVNGVDVGNDSGEGLTIFRNILTITNQFEAKTFDRMINLFRLGNWPRNGKRYYAINFTTGEALWLDTLTICQEWVDNPTWFSGYGYIRAAAEEQVEPAQKRRR